MSGNYGTLISIMDLPPLFCIHLGIGNPLISKLKYTLAGAILHPDFKKGIYIYKYLYKLEAKQIIEKVSLKLICKDKCNIFGFPTLVLCKHKRFYLQFLEV